MSNGLAIGQGVAQGLEKATTNLLNIFLAKEELRKERELFDIKKKQSGLEMKKLETEVSPDMLDLLKRKQKVDTETAEVDLEAKEVTLEQSKKSIEDVMKEFREAQQAQQKLNLPGYGEGETQPGQIDYTMPEDWSFEREVAGGKLKIGGAKKADAQKELKKYQELAAKEGWFIKVDSTLPIEQQVEEARKLYATRKGVEPEKLSYRDLESRWALEQSYADQIRERAKVLLDDQNLDNSDESVDTFLSDPNNRSLILDEIIGK